MSPHFIKIQIEHFDFMEKNLVMTTPAVNDEASLIRDDFVKDPDEYLAYLKREMELMDYDNALYEAGLDGEVRGWEKGRAEGIIEGKAEGKAEGESKAKAEVAKAMLTDGLPAEAVAKYTGLSAEEIAAL